MVLLFTTAALAGTTATADAQIITLEPFTCEPTELLPAEPPEFLQAASDGSGANAKREIIKLRPTNEFIFSWGFMSGK